MLPKMTDQWPIRPMTLSPVIHSRLSTRWHRYTVWLGCECGLKWSIWFIFKSFSPHSKWNGNGKMCMRHTFHLLIPSLWPSIALMCMNVSIKFIMANNLGCSRSHISHDRWILLQIPFLAIVMTLLIHMSISVVCNLRLVKNTFSPCVSGCLNDWIDHKRSLWCRQSYWN